jgi:alkane 1-monooxygenase
MTTSTVHLSKPVAPNAPALPRFYNLGFALPLLFGLLSFVALYLGIGGVYTLAVFVLIALLELILPKALGVVQADQELSASRNRWFAALLIVQLPLQIALISYGIYVSKDAQWWQAVSAGYAVGIVVGSIGINYAHELGHRRQRGYRLLAHGLMACAGYGQFMIEHYRGHHLQIATPLDPATSRRGESIHRFFLRTVVGQFKSAWELEKQRLGTVWSIRNLMLWHTGWAIAAPILLGLLFGPMVALFWVVQATTAILMLESVNYIEHYGLQRKPQPGTANGYERVGQNHSWNTYAQPTNWLLIHLQRHSDHHTYPGRPFAILRPAEAAPELPTGYSGSIIMAVVFPWWWKSAMEKRLLALPASDVQPLK